MPHNENSTGKINADVIYLKPQTPITAAATSGALAVSGAKLYVSDGSEFKVVTSA